MAADLHIHTTASDGTWTPRALVMAATQHRLCTIAVTDHDTTAGVAPVLAVASGLRVITGLEISTDYQHTEVHILGYGMDKDHQQLQFTLEQLRTSRVARARLMVEKLNALGMEVTFDQVKELAGSGTIGRPHVAHALIESGCVSSVAEAFRRFIGTDGVAYVPRFRMTPQEAVMLIRRAHGVPVLAHPGLIGDDAVIAQLVAVGLVGMEVIHSSHSVDQVRHYSRLAKQFGLLESGGSDCHGPRGKDVSYLGQYRIPEQWVDQLLAAREEP